MSKVMEAEVGDTCISFAVPNVREMRFNGFPS